MTLAPDPIRAEIDRLARADRGRLLAALIARIGNFQAAEDALQEAFTSAFVHWGRVGLPHSPQGWLLRVALRKAIDRFRAADRAGRGTAALALLANEEGAEAEEMDIPDDRLRLIFTCCHPALEPKTRVALTLRCLGGLSTAEIARAFLDTETAMGQRLSRARAKIAAAGIPFVVPGPDAWAERLGSVLSVIYLIFNQGYSAHPGASGPEEGLCDEALFLARLLDRLCPNEAETEGLLALMLLAHARRRARLDAQGASLPIASQDRSLWHNTAIAEGLAVLDRAIGRATPGPFQIKAAIGALHVAEAGPDWRQIALLYDSLLRMEPTPVVRLNRAVALAESGSPDAALREMDALATELASYQPFHAALAELSSRAGQIGRALAAYDRAIGLAVNKGDAAFLRDRRRLAEDDH